MSDHTPDNTYRIGEVAELLDLKTHVLRFWETEFPQLAPLRTGKGQRLYTEENVALLRRIQQLLHEQGMTIEGARRVLALGSHNTPHDGAPGVQPHMLQDEPADADYLPSGVLRELRDELLALRNLLRPAHAAKNRTNA